MSQKTLTDGKGTNILPNTGCVKSNDRSLTPKGKYKE